MSSNSSKLRTTLRKSGPQTHSRVPPAADEEDNDAIEWRPDIFPPAITTQSSKTPKDAPPMTIDEFCKRYSLSRSRYFELKQQERTPAELRVGRKTLITAASAREWERRTLAEQKAARDLQKKY